MRILIVSGQSSTLQNATALATACHAASTGLRVLVVGSGPSGLMGELLGETVKSHPTEVVENLAVMELVSLDEFDRQWKWLCDQPRFGITGRVRDIQPDEIPSFPGMDEIASLLVMNRAALSEAFDLVVFGGTTMESLLRGLTMRDMIRWIVRLVSGLDRGPGASRTSQDVAILPGSILNTLSSAGLLQDLRTSLERYCTWLDARVGTKVRLVFPAEEMSTPMLRYAMNGFGLYGMEVDAIFARGEEDGLDSSLRETLESLLVFHTLPLKPTDFAGWAERGKVLYESRQAGLDLPKVEGPDEAPPVFPFRKEVRLHIPLLDAKSLDIGVASEEVVVRLGPFRRHLLVAGMERGGQLRAKIEGETLRLWVES
jgi:anion-transporting  ArsA/GET3 family ATPase